AHPGIPAQAELTSRPSPPSAPTRAWAQWHGLGRTLLARTPPPRPRPAQSVAITDLGGPGTGSPVRWEDGRLTEVYLEAGRRRWCAWVPGWPGWCGPGRDEGAALAALAAYAPRYADVCTRAGIPFDAGAAAAGFEIVERVAGSSATDFGALDAAPALD